MLGQAAFGELLERHALVLGMLRIVAAPDLGAVLARLLDGLRERGVGNVADLDLALLVALEPEDEPPRCRAGRVGDEVQTVMAFDPPSADGWSS